MLRFFIHGVRRPVKRQAAERYLFYTLVAFAVSVVGTRLFLQLAGFPQVGNSELHVAHVLWGGLLLFAALILLLIFANRWVYTTGALVGGAGTGLFIDEVGKFITQSNDYFYPFAAPIIYAFFLIVVLIYLQVRKPPQHDSRSELYAALDMLMEVLDHDLEPQERAELEDRLWRVSEEAEHPDIQQLASALLMFVTSSDLHLAPRYDNLAERILKRVRAWEQRWGKRNWTRFGLVVALGIMGAVQLTDLALSFLALISDEALVNLATELFLTEEQVDGATSLGWFIVRMALEGVTGASMLAAAVLLFIRREHLGNRVASMALILSLTTVNLLVFYFDQFRTIGGTLAQLIVLVVVIRYRQRYLAEEETAPAPAGQPAPHKA